MKSPAFQFYPNDWLSSPSIMLMTPTEEGAYIRLLALDWANDGIPDDDNALAMLSRLGEGWLKGSSRVVKECFNNHPTKPGYLTNERLQKEREKQIIWKQKCSLGGQHSAEKRLKSKTSEDLKGSSTNLPRVVEVKGNSSSSSSSSNINAINIKRPKNLEDVVSVGFKSGVSKEDCEAFWHHFESTGWIDKNGHEVQNWQSKLMSWKNFQFSKQSSQKSPMQSARIEEKIEIKELVL